MSAYMIAQIQIDDPKAYKNYLEGFMPIFNRHEGKLLATSNSETLVMEGEWAYPNTVVMKFPSIKHAQNWFNDPDYRELKKHRLVSAQANLALIQGLE